MSSRPSCATIRRITLTPESLRRYDNIEKPQGNRRCPSEKETFKTNYGSDGRQSTGVYWGRINLDLNKNKSIAKYQTNVKKCPVKFDASRAGGESHAYT